MIPAGIKLANNRLVASAGIARMHGKNMFFPICAQTALRPSFNNSNGTNVSGRAINENPEHQISLMKWLHQEINCPVAYPCMDLNLEAGAVARANKTAVAFMDMGEEVALEVVPFLDENSVFANLNPAYPSSDPLMLSRLEFFKRANEDKVLEGLMLSAWISGPFTLAGKITRTDAITSLSMNALADPEGKEAETFRACLDYAASTAAAYSKALERAGAKSIVMLEPSVKWTNPFIFQEFVVPRINGIIDGLEIPVIFHACGDTSPFFASFAGINAEGFSLDKEIDLMQMSKLRPDALMIGNYNNTNIFDETPEAITDGARTMVRKNAELDASGHYLPATGCEITSPITPDQLRAFAAGAHPPGQL